MALNKQQWLMYHKPNKTKPNKIRTTRKIEKEKRAAAEISPKEQTPKNSTF